MKYILAIDPGNIESGFCVMGMEDYKPYLFDKVKNEDILDRLFCDIDPKGDEELFFDDYKIEFVVIEMIASYGMSVGAEVFDTCVWIGRFVEHVNYISEQYVPYIYRIEEKMNICHSPQANDTTIKQALVDRFAYGVPNHGKGTKKEQGWFYGFSKDVWSAYAVGVTFLDKMKNAEI